MVHESQRARNRQLGPLFVSPNLPFLTACIVLLPDARCRLFHILCKGSTTLDGIPEKLMNLRIQLSSHCFQSQSMFTSQSSHTGRCCLMVFQQSWKYLNPGMSCDVVNSIFIVIKLEATVNMSVSLSIYLSVKIADLCCLNKLKRCSFPLLLSLDVPSKPLNSACFNHDSS